MPNGMVFNLSEMHFFMCYPLYASAWSPPVLAPVGL